MLKMKQIKRISLVNTLNLPLLNGRGLEHQYITLIVWLKFQIKSRLIFTALHHFATSNANQKAILTFSSVDTVIVVKPHEELV